MITVGSRGPGPKCPYVLQYLSSEACKLKATAYISGQYTANFSPIKSAGKPRVERDLGWIWAKGPPFLPS